LDIDALVKTRRSGGGKRREREKELEEDEQIEAAVAVALAGGTRKEDRGWKREDGASSSLGPDAPPQVDNTHPHNWGKSLLEQADEIQLTPTRPASGTRAGPMVVRTS